MSFTYYFLVTKFIQNVPRNSPFKLYLLSQICIMLITELRIK